MPPVVRAQLDYYAVLEIAPSADTAEVNAAFLRLAWRYHPDRNPAPGATPQFQDINEAHQVLFDPARRADYDAKWHPKADQHRRATRAPLRPQVRRHLRRHRHVRTALLTLFAMLFVSSAWVAIFAPWRWRIPDRQATLSEATRSSRQTPRPTVDFRW